MEFIAELILNFVVEVLLSGFGELLLELGLRGAKRAHRAGVFSSRALTITGFLVLGGIAGAIVSLFFPERFVVGNPVPGISLLLSPLANGLLMSAYGDWRERRGQLRTPLSTFWGGAAFAFGMAAARLWWVTSSAA